MAVQQKILTTVPAYAGSAKKKPAGGGESQTVSLAGGVGTLALGKAGDVVTRAYGPVARSFMVEASDLTDGELEFGTYVAGKGILVNPNDCAGFSAAIATPFDTKSLKKGQVGTFLVSGACIVTKAQVAAIAAGMKVQNLYGYTATMANTDVCEIEVNGFDNDTPASSTL